MIDNPEYMRRTLDRIASAMGCVPEDDDDLVEAVRLLVAERDEERAKVIAERARSREATQTLIAGIGSIGPESIGPAAERAVKRITLLTAERDALVTAVRREREAQDDFDNAGWDAYASAARAIAFARGSTDDALKAAGGV